MTVVSTRAWDEARALLDVPGLPLDPRMLPRPARVKIATVLAREGWPQRLIGDALGVGQQRVSRWLNGDEPTWQQAAGRGPSKQAKPPAPKAAPPLVEVGPRLDEAEPDGWWDDDDEPEVEPERAPRANPKAEGVYGWATPMVVARLRSKGHEVSDDGTITRWAGSAARVPQEAASAPAAEPAPIPAPPALRRPWTAPERPSGPAPGVIAVELECGHIERDLPLDGPWRQREWVACTRCRLAHRRIRRQVREQ